ncbi:hypothetical protein RIR_jg35634.t1 [Rhizophagus irregularis DAOM 181602=DAOM 197198]|nr:hypothetical protein RIR_jg35634.t1 [Rhizophagus irregularis DAOM 181602=DAOM 197198]
MLPPNSSISTSLSNNSTYTLPQHIIDELRSQIKKIADTLSTLDATVSWMQDTISLHEYRLTELKSMMGYDNLTTLIHIRLLMILHLFPRCWMG